MFRKKDDQWNYRKDFRGIFVNMWVFSRGRREREGSTTNRRGIRGGGGLSARVNVDEGEKIVKYDRKQHQDQ